MEFLVIVSVVAVLCIILGISMEYLVYAALALIILTIAAMGVFFLVSAVLLIFSEKAEGTLLRIEKNEKYNFRTRIYNVDGTDFRCIYPTDAIIRRKNADNCNKIYRLRLVRKMRVVFDRTSLITFACGFSFCAFLIPAVIFFILRLI
ncbi:MAG: hypothetical protein PUB97_00735 [Ruminococcus sp.]|nr:hypothetical protein [Ruminococcus sp.]